MSRIGLKQSVHRVMHDPAALETESLRVKVAASGKQLVRAEEVFQDILRLEVDHI